MTDKRKANMTDASPYLSSLQRDGFVVIPSLLSSPEITTLRDAATKATTLTRTGQWPYFRTVPKQFPPWPKDVPPASEGGIWGVQHLLHPDMPGRREFAKFYFSEKVLGIVEELLGLKATNNIQKGSGEEEEPLVMELLNLLVAPETRDFELRWHRDDIPPTVTPEEELQLLKSKSPQGRQSHAQYNLALCPDTSLIVIPGSHRRVRTETERNADPYEAELPGQLTVRLEPGDAVFYDSNILHRGVYKPKPEGGEETRLTLHGSVGLNQTSITKDGDTEAAADKAKVRATAVLQHGVGIWIDRDDADLSYTSDRAERMRRNLIAMGRGENVGFSLEG
ncbi:phytanoyl-CoA dioxygenase family protein [Talaromyces stipitatus ATCC 10500]|uniref:Phytanoyl-CoA dioxygenase family protein n=1 Tax=Talaromyces stipitatus (strain ATCC 10500 / CBS 375.48 / QM 6759 / NRRL 1006) TaxID=441959 RepID=B8MBP6_TALSN|nr:phytanoyl-CoA dioxygenase family protein [Talaromyces stipitatus ATCC 10500]EED18179.1 phytanoyl-CoA dioxygenase family protein [Talaromyces stipitatus ATCC 10500]